MQLIVLNPRKAQQLPIPQNLHILSQERENKVSYVEDENENMEAQDSQPLFDEMDIEEVDKQVNENVPINSQPIEIMDDQPIQIKLHSQ